MKALKTINNFLLFEADRIEFGIWDEPDIEKWAMFNSDNEIILYAIDNDYTVVEFDPADKPEDYAGDNYFFIDGQFIPNPDWQEPPLPIEEQVAYLAGDQAQLAADLDFIAMELGVDLDD